MQLQFTPPKFCITVVFDFSWDDCREIGNNGNNGLYAKFWRVNKMHYGLCENGELLVCKWRQRGHVSGQEQMHFSPLGTKRHFHVDSSKRILMYWQPIQRLFSCLWTVEWWLLAFIENSNDTSWCLSDLHQHAQGSSTPMSFSQMLISICYKIS